MVLEKYYFGICFVAPSSDLDSSIFGFSEFLSALALLVIVYTVTDIRYRFRVAVAPAPLLRLTYILIGTIGFGTLLTDIWVSVGWFVPQSLITLPVWQGIFGFFFLLLAMTWIYYAAIKPPIFSPKNYQNFTDELYRVILKGSDSDLPIIADELIRSANSLVSLSRQDIPREEDDASSKKLDKNYKTNVGDYAHDVLLLIGNRKLCRHIIASSPATAMAFFEDMATFEKYELPIGQFVRNISTEAIINKDSLLYHEDDGYDSGLIGYVKPLSQAIYGNYRLVEKLASTFGSPLDIHHQAVSSWDAMQFEAYSRAVLLTLEGSLKSGNGNRHSFALTRALGIISDSCRDANKLNDIQSDVYSTNTYKKLSTAVDFIRKAIGLIDEQQRVPSTTLRTRDRRSRHSGLYNVIADLMFKIIFYVSAVTSPPDKCWSIHYNTVWSEFFDCVNEGKAWKIIQFKLRRLLYDEIMRLEKYPNFKSSRILGYCLNVMGMRLGEKGGIDKAYHSLHKVILVWTTNNYLRLKTVHPAVADSCLIGSISYDEDGASLVKEFAMGLRLEAPKEYMELRPVSDLK